MYKYIPNTVTLLSSFFGVLAVSFAFENNLIVAGYCILFAAFCDFADGLLARLLNAKSPIGADLDSLSDVVSFGVAPSIVAYQLLKTSLPENLSYFAYFAFLIVPFSALRLAIFNNSTNQTTSFVGIPVPANAMLWVGLIFLKECSFAWVQQLYNPYLLAILVITFSLLLVSQFSFFSFKFSKDTKITEEKDIILMVIFSCISLFLFKIGALFFIIIFYAFIGIFSSLRKSLK